MDSPCCKSLEETVVDIIKEQQSKSKEGLTLRHIHGQLLEMNHPDCPTKKGSQAKLHKLLEEMPSLRCFEYQKSIAFYVHEEEMPESEEAPVCDNIGIVHDKLVQILLKLEDMIGQKRPWEVQKIKVSEIELMREDVLDALGCLETESTKRLDACA